MANLAERAVLMKFSAGLPQGARKDKRLTADVKASNRLGEHAGKWTAELYPPGALSVLKSLQTEARDYHNDVTFPFGVPRDTETGERGEGATGRKAAEPIAGIGILGAALIPEYREKMRVFGERQEKLTQEFLADPWQWVNWAVKEHNGTFEPKNYPGCSKLSTGEVVLDVDKFRAAMRKRIYMVTDILPIPGSEQFSASIMALVGADASGVDARVQDTSLEAQRELMRRMIAPVKAMAEKLAEQPKMTAKGAPKADIVFRDTLVSNIKDIANLAPKMNLAGDPQIDAFAAEMQALFGEVSPEVLRENKDLRATVQETAAGMLKRLSSYSL